jgi:chemotaxis protein histidine kinase CheA
MVGIPDNGTDSIALDKSDAINLLLNRDNTPNQASENIQESEGVQEAPVEEVDDENDEEVVEGYSSENEEEAEDYQDSEESDEEETTDVYLATVDGEQVEVTADDLIKSYQIEATAQKRLYEAAEEKKRILAEAQQVEAERKYYAENLNLLMQQLQQFQSGNMTDEQWQQLYDDDPVAYKSERGYSCSTGKISSIATRANGTCRKAITIRTGKTP